ncbi:MAG: porin [Pirellulaceae bacterium]|nr:porin [Pirellulaceae bacterium]HJN08972.1 porin [Pirellulaceae bacterium]
MSLRVALPSSAMLLVWALSALACITATHAQSFSSTPYEPHLFERLEAAERRIQQLEAPQARMFPAHARENTLDSFHHRLSELECVWEQDAQAEAKKQIGSAGKPSLKINGRIHLDYWNFTNDSPGIGFFEHPDAGVDNYGTDPEDRIFFRRVRLKFEGDLFETMLYRMQFDLNTTDSGEMKDMYIGFKELPILGTLLIGNQKRPIGLDHLNSSRFNVFIERPLVVEAFNEDTRRLGIAAYNNTEDLLYNWRYGLYALENPARDGKVIGDSMQLSGNARLASSPWYDESSGGRGYFHWAISGMVAKPDGDVSLADTNANQGRFRTRAELRSDSRWLDTGAIAGADWYEILGLEAVLNIGPFHVVGEYQSNWMQRDSDTAGTGPDLDFHGGYVHIAYMLTGEHVPLKRKSGTIDRVRPFENFFVVNTCNNGVGRGRGAWQVALRCSYLDLSDRDIRGGVENNTTLGLVWYFNAYSSLQFNAIYGDIEDRAPVGGYSDGHFTALGTRLRVDF